MDEKNNKSDPNSGCSELISGRWVRARYDYERDVQLWRLAMPSEIQGGVIVPRKLKERNANG